MREILWFRRDLRVNNSAILSNGVDSVLPIFIFDKIILGSLDRDDKRVTFIYDSVIKLKNSLKSIGLDLAIFYGEPKQIFTNLKKLNFDRVLCSIDFDDYSKKRDLEIEKILPMSRYIDSFILNPKKHLKKDSTPYRVFTPFYKSLVDITSKSELKEYKLNSALKLVDFDYSKVPTIEDLGFKRENLESFLYSKPSDILDSFESKIETYKSDRDYFYKDATSNISVHLRFGTISPVEIFNRVKLFKNRNKESLEFFIRELFWREFYNYILYHFPNSEFENFNLKVVNWINNKDDFEAWCSGNTGIPIVDSAMKYLNSTGLMHNRLRMIVSSFLTKNLLIDWKYGERYFAKKLLDYEASSNIGSWQWAASTGADSVPYFRVFNPYLQSMKFDKEAVFIKSILPELKFIESELIHKESGLRDNIFINYLNPIVDIKSSRDRAINIFKDAKPKR